MSRQVSVGIPACIRVMPGKHWPFSPRYRFLEEPRLLFLSYYFSIKWLIPFYPALIAQAASGGEKCMDYVF